MPDDGPTSLVAGRSTHPGPLAQQGVIFVPEVDEQHLTKFVIRGRELRQWDAGEFNAAVSPDENVKPAGSLHALSRNHYGKQGAYSLIPAQIDEISLFLRQPILEED